MPSCIKLRVHLNDCDVVGIDRVPQCEGVSGLPQHRSGRDALEFARTSVAYCRTRRDHSRSCSRRTPWAGRRQFYRTIPAREDGRRLRERYRALHVQRGLISRMQYRLLALILKPWHVYALGFLFGLGFDTGSKGRFSRTLRRSSFVWRILVVDSGFSPTVHGQNVARPHVCRSDGGDNIGVEPGFSAGEIPSPRSRGAWLSRGRSPFQSHPELDVASTAIGASLPQ